MGNIIYSLEVQDKTPPNAMYDLGLYSLHDVFWKGSKKMKQNRLQFEIGPVQNVGKK